MGRAPWYKEGIRWSCQGSGKCCVSRGQFGYVYLDLKDRQRFARHLKISTGEFTRKYCDKDQGFYHLKQEQGVEDCLFLKDNKCGAYEARPTQCRTWPFWPEVLKAKAWQSDVAQFCPGVGKGQLHSFSEIEKMKLEQMKSEKNMEKEQHGG